MESNSAIYADSFIISSLSAIDNGRYFQCEVFINASQTIYTYGEVTIFFSVSVVNDLVVTPAKRSVLLMASPPPVSNGIIIIYIVSYNVNGSTNIMTMNFTADNQQRLLDTLGPLLPFTNYVFSVRACTTLECSNSSDNVTAVTLEDAPSMPINFLAEAINATSVNLTWDEPLMSNGMIQSYTITILDDVMNVVQNETALNSVMMSIITQLTPNTGYVVNVSAVTVRPGDAASVTFLTPALPTAPLNVTANAENMLRTLIVQWEPPSIPGGIIKTYMVTYNNITMDISSNDTIYIITGLSPYTDYFITVLACTSNGCGNDSDVIIGTTAEEAPNPPLNVNATVINSTTIQISWDQPNITNGIIRYYTVVYHLNDNLQTTEQNFTDTMIVVTDLDPFNNYVFYVLAITVAPSDPSDNATVMTAQAAPSAPINVTARNVSSTSILIMWEPPMTRNGIIVSYRVEFTRIIDNVVDNAITTNTSVTIGMLEKFTAYQVQVFAMTVAEGDGSDIVAITTDEDTPGIPGDFFVNEVNSTAIIVSWVRPSVTNGIITMYRVSYSRGNHSALDDGAIMVQITATANTSYQIIISELDPFTIYTLAVRAFTRIGSGNLSKTLNILTDPSSSSAPQNFSVVVLNSTAVELSWRYPESPNGEIRGYLILIAEFPNHEEILVNITLDIIDDASDQTFVITNLTPFTIYTFRVRAFSFGGQNKQAYFVHFGITTEGIIRRTAEDVPEAPTNFTAKAIASTMVELSWGLPNIINGILLYYTVEFCNDTNTLTEVYSNVTFDDIITGLNEDTLYSFVIYANTSTGKGDDATDTALTFEDRPSASPQNVGTTVANSSAISIFWNPPPFLDQNGEIIGYQLMITNQNRTNTPAIIYNVTNFTSYTANMLEEFEVYNITVAAWTSVGLGPFSDPVNNQTFEDAPSMKPFNVTIFAVVFQSFMLSWDPPLIGEQNGILIRYHVIVIETQIQYSDDGEEIRGMERYLNRTYNVSEGRVQLIDMLHPGYNYTVSIAAATEPGIGPFSDPITVRTEMNVAPYEAAVVGETLYSKGDRLILNCTSEGGPQLEYYWLFLEDVISNSSMIIINSVNTSHIGNYTCIVTNDAGSDNDTITVYVAPYDVEITGIRRYPYGSDIVLNCTLEGGPLLEYSWILSDNTIDNDTMIVIASAIVSNGGDYTCNVMNNAGFDSTTTIIYIGPHFIIDPVVNQEVLIDGEFNLTCVSEGFPRPSITWFMNSTMINNGVSNFNISMNTLSSTLTKFNASINDSGIYYCQAVSSEFSGLTVLSDVAIITVVERPVVTPLEHNVTLGTTITFECNEFGSPPFSYQWFMRNAVTGDDILLFREIDKFYNIWSTVYNDTGGYFCEASNSLGVLSNSTPAYLLVRPSILDNNPIMQKVYPGMMVSFSCRAEGFSELSYSWFMLLPGARIGIEIANENDTMYIVTDPMYHDNATGYYCVASNSEGIAISTTSTIIVLRPNITDITITPRPSDNDLLLHEFNDTISLTCTAEGGPKIMTRWQFDDGSSVVVTVADGNSSVTYVVPSLSTDHTGVYYCEAIIDGMTNTSINYTLFVAPYNVTITEIANDNIVNYTCNANGGLGNVYGWLRLRDNIVVSMIQEITLNNTDPLDGGDYQCSITNAAGFTSTIITLNVAAVIVTSPQTQNVTNGQSFMLICNATGYPVPSIEWTLNGAPYVTGNSSITLIEGLRSNTSNITVENAMATDTGTYKCVATNVGSSDTQDANVTVQNCPNKPGDVQVFDVNSRNLTINWTEPHSNNDPIISYNISYQNPDCLVNANAVTQNVTIVSMEEQIIITNLHPGEVYMFTIIAINNICHSQSSLPASVHTTEEVPVAPPVVSAIPNQQSINVSWMNLDCQDSHGNITMYEVHYVSSDFGDYVNQTLSTLSGDETSIEIDGLEEFANYTLKMRAYTMVGPGPYSNLMNILTLPDFPSDSVRNLTAINILSTSVELIWEPVNERDKNGIILSYNIYYQIHDNSDRYTVIFHVTERNYTIRGLMENEVYLFAVTAVNQVGESIENVSIVIQTNESTPSTPVQNVMISNITDSDNIAVLISWDSPSDPNGIIRYYRIEIVQAFNPLDNNDRRKRNIPLDDTILNVFVNITSDDSETSFNLTLNDLVAYRVYNYSIFAANSVGEGLSADGVFLTREDTPLAPTNLTLNIPGNPHSSNVLLVNWESPLCDQGILSGYELCYIEYSVGDCDINGIKVIISSPDQLSYTITNLSVNSNYVVEVRGRTGAGLGDLANATGATDEDAPDPVMDMVAQFLPINTTRGIYNITWTPPASTNGSFYQILEYSYSSAYSIGQTYIGSYTTAELDQNQNQFIIEAFYYTNYNFTITTINIKYNISSGQAQSSVQSSATEPTFVRDIKVVMSTPASILISWNHPEYPNSQLLDYIVYYDVKPEMLQPDETISIDGFENETVGIVTSYNLTGLAPLTNYTILITVSGRDVGIAPFVKELLQRTNTSGPVVIQSSGGDVENQSIINEFVFNGTDSKLSLTCTSIYQNEIIELIRLNTFGSAEEEQSYSSYSYNITFINPTDDFMSMLRCKSKNTRLYKDVTVIQRNPFFDLLTNTTISAPLASSSIISIIIAIDSDGTTSHQDVITESLVLTRPDDEDFMGKFEQDSINFQLYHYMFPPLQRQNMGQYVISSEINDGLQITIEVMITTEALNISTSFISVTLLEGNTVSLSCTPSVIETVLSWTHNGIDLHEDENTTFLPVNLNHDLILDNTVIDDSGRYTCRAVLNDEVVEQNITVTVVPACASNFSGALFWNNSRRNISVTQLCSTLHPNFRSGVGITRRCNNDGTWSPVNMIACTMFIDSNPVITIHFTVAVNDSNTIDSTTILSNVLKQVQLNVIVSNSFNNTWSYKSDKSLFLSFRISVGLQSMILPTTLVNDIKKGLTVNASNIIPSGFLLTDEGFMILGFQPNSSCLCNDTSNNTIRTVCSGPSTAPCSCSAGRCMCNDPTYVGDGRVCGLDSDNDGFPDDEDFCPDIYSVTKEGKQSATFCTNQSSMIGGGCPFGPDKVWNITWPATNASTLARQKCPGGSEAQGIATRQCSQNGDWGTPNVSQCRTVEQIRLEMRAEELNTLVANMFVNDDRDLTEVFMPEVVEDIADELNEITNTSTPLLPNDVTSTANTLNIIILVTNVTINEVDQPLVSNVIEDVVDVLDTLLDERNDVSFEDISTQSSEEEASGQSVSEQLLMNTEQVGVLLVSTLNATNNETVKTISNRNIVIEAQIPLKEDVERKQSIQFPSVNNTSNVSSVFGNMTPMIEIPSAFVLRELEEGNQVPIINSVARNSRLPTDMGQRIESLILSSQISTDPQRRVFLDGEAVQLTFNIGMQGNATRFNPRCAFFRFASNSNESGRFSSDGITQSGATNGTFVQCTSTHLTSFAVLVDTSGESSDSEALSIVSYIGCSISIACLLFTIGALIALRKRIFNQTQHFLHLNLSIALLLGLVTFVSGIETATEYRESCLAVAILLHYFFMAAFCWMLSEGILMFIMLYFIFYNGLFKRKRFFFAVGWGLPVPIVVISAALSHEYYGINDRCWISEENGTIWAFIGPMLLIILINVFFLISILYRIYTSKQEKMTAKEASTIDTVKALLKGAVIVIPVLGCTWVFGLLTINENTLAFAWIFTIFNSLQGLFITIMYVLRNEKFLKIIKCQAKDSRRSKILSTSEKISTKRFTVKSDDDNSILSRYNKVICNKYVTASSYSEEDYDNNQTRVVSPNIFNVRAGVENYVFDEYDEIQFVGAEQQESTSLSDFTASQYLRNQHSAGIIYPSKVSDEEAKL